MLVANFSSNTVNVFVNGGTGNFTLNATLTVVNSPGGVTAADIDGDGDLDMLVPNIFGNNVSVRINNGSGVFSNGADVAVGREPYRVAMSDLDADGDLDMLVSNFAGNSVSIRFNDISTRNPLATALKQASTELVLYPNPAHSKLMLLLPNVAAAVSMKASLFNSLGQQVRANIVLSNVNTTVDVSNLAKGVYTIRVEDGLTPFVKRVVIE